MTADARAHRKVRVAIPGRQKGAGAVRVFDEDVGAFAQFRKAVAALGIVEIDYGAALVGVAVQEGQGAIRCRDVSRKRRAPSWRI